MREGLVSKFAAPRGGSGGAADDDDVDVEDDNAAEEADSSGLGGGRLGLSIGAVLLPRGGTGGAALLEDGSMAASVASAPVFLFDAVAGVDVAAATVAAAAVDICAMTGGGVSGKNDSKLVL